MLVMRKSAISVVTWSAVFATATIRIRVVIASATPTLPVWAISKPFADPTTQLMSSVTIGARVFAVFAIAILVPTPMR